MARSNRTEAKQASKQPATGTLIVRAVAVGGDPVDPADLPGQPALPAGEAVVGDRTEELRDGAARFDGLPAGEHAVAVRPGQGFAAPDRLFVLDEQGQPAPADGPVAVGPGEERTVIAACSRTQVHLTGTVELPAVGKAKSGPRPELPVTLEVSRAGERLATVTCEQGSIDAWVDASGPVEVTAPPLVDKGGRRLVPEQRQVTAEPDGGPVTVRYCHAGTIRVSAILEEDTGSRRAAGVHFTLLAATDPYEVLEDRTTSGRHPVAVFGDLPPGGYLVVADRETVAGHPPLQLVRPPRGRLLVMVLAGKTADLTGAFAFEREPAVVTGDVRAADGTGLAGIRVELRDPTGGEPPQRTLTDGDGRYVFRDVEPDLWLVGLVPPIIDSDGRWWQPQPPEAGEQEVTPAAGQTVEADQFTLELAPGAIRGRVVGTDDNGMAGVEVVLEPADGGSRRARLSDAGGWFTFAPLDPGSYILRLVAPVEVGDGLFEPAAGTGDRQSAAVGSGRATTVTPFRLERVAEVGRISGRLRDGDGNAVAGLPVELREDGQDPRTVTTDGRGMYIFAAVIPGVQLVRVGGPAADGTVWRPVPPDSGQRSVAVEAGDTTHVADIVLEQVPAPGTITGFVRLDRTGLGLAGVPLVVRSATGGPVLARTTTDAEGAYSVPVPAGVRAVDPEEIPIVAGDRRWRPKPPDDRGTRVVQVVAGQTVAADPLVVEPVAAPIEVSGRVLAANLDVPPGAAAPAPAGEAPGLQGVRVRLHTAAGGVRLTTTDATGEFTFDGVPNGDHEVRLDEDPFEAAGLRWEPVIGDSGIRPVTVQGRSVEVAPLLVQPERHRIFGTVTRPDGSPAAFVDVSIRDALGEEVVTVRTDFDGEYEADVAQEGRYQVQFLREDGSAVRRTVTVASDVRLDQTVEETAGTGGPAVQATQDFAAFPVLTESVTPTQLPGAGGPISSIGQTVEAALREALGWRPKPNDPRAFNAALLQSFDRRLVEGHTESVWTPRTYVAQVQADLGAITGAQASLYSRARVALDAALPLLDGLRPLDPAADEQDTEAIRSIIRSELIDLVTELGVEGGPRISRVDDLLDLLLGGQADARVGATATTPAGGQLGELLRRFGLDADRVETVDEEEVLTNALILVDYVREIDTSWQQRRAIFDPASSETPFLGTQLVLLSRSLAVTAESVTEVGFTLDSVFLGVAERLAIRLTFTDNDQPGGVALEDSRGATILVRADTPSILLEELLRWVERVASEEGPRLLQDGGKDGASALTPVLDRLRTLVRGSLLTTGTGPNQGLQPPESVPAGYATARVQRALSELAKYLDDAAELARRIQRTPVRR